MAGREVPVLRKGVRDRGFAAVTLRILWLSDRIIGGFSAYSKVSRECCVRLAEMGHTVAHVPMGRANLMGAWAWRGVLILPSGLDPWGEDVALRHYLDFRADVLVTLKDVWVFRALHRLAVNFVPYVPVAHSPVSPMITSRLHTALAVLVPSRFGQRELMRAGIEPPVHYVPHGVDTGVFRPLEDRAACKRLWFLEEDDFTVLVVAFNRARKMLDRHLRAFRRFREDNPDIKSHMILWTDVRGAAHRARDGFLEGGVGLGVADVGVDLLPLIVDLGLEEDVIWPETRLAREGIPDWSGPEGWDMVKLYNAADVLLGITGGEGFFLPAIEAQACLPKGETVLCRHGLLPIEKVSNRDHRVLGLDGRYKKVLRKHRRWYEGQLVTVKALGMLPFTVTEDHPILVAEVRKTDHCYVPEFGKVVYRRRFTGRMFWKKATDIRPGDYVVFPRLGYGSRTGNRAIYCRPIRNTSRLTIVKRWHVRGHPVEVNAEVAEFMGRYLADGYADLSNGVSISFGPDEERELEYFMEIVRRNFSYEPRVKETEAGYVLRVGGPVLARRFLGMFGHDAREKRIPNIIMKGPHVLRFLRGYIGGDGHVNGRGDIIMSTVSKCLALQLQQLLSRVGIFATIQANRRKSKTRIRGREVKQHPVIYRVRIPAGSVGLLRQGGFDMPAPTRKTSKSRAIKAGRFFLVPVTEVRKRYYRGWVFNMTTEDGTFQVSNIITHNCGTPVIVTDYASAPEVCGCGYCVPVADWAVFSTPGVRWALADVGKAAEFLARVANSDRERMARRARRFAERFDWGRVMRLYWGPLLEELEAEVRPLVTRDGVGAWEAPGAPGLHVWG
ncbi:MAG: hypothetical protein DRJ69_07035 [Thermoprotei archaeon]|nr:MAG: hypothetical protein DRJ69_07035 [Thermoprotei archaeon]